MIPQVLIGNSVIELCCTSACLHCWSEALTFLMAFLYMLLMTVVIFARNILSHCFKFLLQNCPRMKIENPTGAPIELFGDDDINSCLHELNQGIRENKRVSY